LKKKTYFDEQISMQRLTVMVENCTIFSFLNVADPEKAKHPRNTTAIK